MTPTRTEALDGPVRRLMDAVVADDVPLVRMLLEEHPDLVDACGAYRKTALHLAAEGNRGGVARLLLEGGASPEALTEWGMTPLQWAANMGSSDVADQLLAAGVSNDFWSAAGLGMLATVQSYWGIADALRDGEYLICHDVMTGRCSMEIKPADDADIIDHAFYIACRNGHLGVAQFLLERGADVNARGFFDAPALHWAAINGHAAVVRFLLDHGADPGIRDGRWNGDAHGWASQGSRPEVVSIIEGAAPPL